MPARQHDDIRQAVRQRYSAIAETRAVDASAPSCCGDSSATDFETQAHTMGYSADETEAAPEGANLGLGCGNPMAIASLQAGETVLDLGSGAGFDCFLAARAVGDTGHVIGVDMTPEMLHKARENASKNGFQNVVFRLGEIEYLPVADQTVNVIISNCVINLSPEKPQVFREAFRVLKRGGRLAISDVVATAAIPDDEREGTFLEDYCVRGASLVNDLEQMLTEAGFVNIRIQPKDESKTFIREWAPETHIEAYIVSATIEAVKP